MRVCASNLKQLGAAFSMYLDDNYGFAIPGPVTWDWQLRPEPLMKYCKQTATGNDKGNPKRVWICPGDRGYGSEPPRWRYYGQAASSYYYPYGAYLASSGHTDVLRGTTPINTPRRPDQWARPSRDMLLCDWSPGFHRGRKDSNSDDKVKCVNFLMLDLHIAVGTSHDRINRIPYYAIVYDNPYSMMYSPGTTIPAPK